MWGLEVLPPRVVPQGGYHKGVPKGGVTQDGSPNWGLPIGVNQEGSTKGVPKGG
jgi:hypothetical protein